MRLSIVCTSVLVASTGVVSGATEAYQDLIEAAGPILWYSFDEAAGNAANQGSLGASHDATYTAAVTRSVDAIGDDDAAAFPSSAAYMESLSASPLTGNPTFSCEALVGLSAGPANLWGPFLHWGSGLTGREVYFGVHGSLNNRIYAGFYNAGVRLTQDIDADRWQHVVWVREGGNDSDAGSTVYINGVACPVELAPQLSPGFVEAADIDVASTVFRINRAADSLGNRYFNGALDELALYDRALTPAEIAERAAAAVPPCPGDVTGDRAVNFDDLNAVLSQWNQSVFKPGWGADANGDGAVNFDDLNVVLVEWEEAC